VVRSGFLEAKDQRAKVGQAQPVRHDAPQHPPFAKGSVVGTRPTLAGDDKHELQAVALSAAEKSAERLMRLVLPKTVTVDDGIGGPPAAPQRGLCASFQRDEWWKVRDRVRRDSRSACAGWR
jgi:hypothetical protein